MKRITPLLVAGFIALGATSANAAPGWTASSNMTLIVYGSAGVEVDLPTAGNPMACAQANRYRLATSVTNYQVIAAGMMTSKAQGKPISVYANACASDGATLILASIE